MKTMKTLTSCAVAATLALSVAGPVMAQDKRQQDKNTMRNLGIGLGAGAAHEVIKGRLGTGLILGAGAAYAAKKAEDQRKAQQREEERRLGRNNGSGVAYANRYAANDIDVVLNDERVTFADSGPLMMGERVYVPLRGVLERMGASVAWNPSSRTVTAVKGDRDVRLPVNSYTAYVDESQVSLDAPARIVNGRTMVPLRFISEAFGAQVTWDSGDREVHINT